MGWGAVADPALAESGDADVSRVSDWVREADAMVALGLPPTVDRPPAFTTGGPGSDYRYLSTQVYDDPEWVMFECGGAATHCSYALIPSAEALRLAHWILDHYAEPQ
jgi:hypothetical protein